MLQQFVFAKSSNPPKISSPWNVSLTGTEGPFIPKLNPVEWFSTKKKAIEYADSMNLVISYWKEARP